MGLAASQARYLSLTARKTNVEYMGQQVNQQRTLLANESANMYNELMSLPVPVAPKESDYTTNEYLFSDSEYKFDVDSISMNSDGSYNIPLTRYIEGNVAQLTVSYSSLINDDEEHPENSTITLDGTTYPILSTLIDNKSDKVNDITIEVLAKSNVNFIEDDPPEEEGKTKVYYYTSGGQDYYVSQIDYKNLAATDTPVSFRPSYITIGEVEKSGNISAYLTKEENGRYSAITVNGDYPELGLSKGEKFDMNIKSVVDEQAYEQAMKDYEYQKAVYDKKIEEINAKTRNIQIQDRTLELKLRQLDTEQEALKTELDSVKQVIKDSCERIFKTFQSS